MDRIELITDPPGRMCAISAEYSLDSSIPESTLSFDGYAGHSFCLVHSLGRETGDLKLRELLQAACVIEARRAFLVSNAETNEFHFFIAVRFSGI